VDEDKERSLKRRKGVDPPQRRFGLIAIERGFIKADHLYEALMRQRAQETGGAERKPLGMILKDLGYLTVSQINEIMKTLEPEAESKKNVPKAVE
jgi:hypothetical protein